jgi:flagellin
MTRINTNVSSLTAQKTLTRSNADLQLALTRLSTGLRINTGKDDPAGLIASESLRSDIVSTQKAITNSERAAQLIATADSALGQISSLLNDIRALVTEAANTGVLSPEQLAANQLQVDASLEAINRIAQMTSFQGRKILDGSLDFIVSGSIPTVKDLRIEQANLGSAGSVAVAVDIQAAATQASVTTTVPLASPAQQAQVVLNFNDTSSVTVTAATAGASFNGTQIEFVTDAAISADQAVATYDAANSRILVFYDGTSATAANIATAINGLAEFTASSSGAGGFDAVNDGGDGVKGSLTGGADATNGLLDNLVVQISGQRGSDVFTFEAGATITQIRDAINLVSDAIGVQASVSGGTLTLSSLAYGSDAFVEVNVISEGPAGTFGANLSATRDIGSNIVATVNGVTASGKGNTLSINTAALDLTLTVEDGSSTDFNFTITGGGALFQLGPDVVGNQQSRIGIQSVNTARLGGVSGRLYELASGGAKNLVDDPSAAASVVEEAIAQITSLRGRLGAFQRTTLETNIFSLNDTLEKLTEAESSIRDADFAVESARLTRAQILVQSGTAVLAIANSNPQNALALLR